MVMNEDILGGLKSGLERGEPLHKVMMSLYNAGYKKDEIEEAAHSLSSSPVMESAPDMEEKGNEKNSKKTEEKPKKMAFAPLVKKPEKNMQKASDYGKTKPDSKKNKIMIILMIALAVVFVGVLLLFLLTK